MILIVKHIDIEGPGTLGDYLEKKGYKFDIKDLGQGNPLPVDLSPYDGIVVLGGPMNVYEEDKYPFLKKENQFIKNVIKQKTPYLGICLGSQLLAKACAAKVVKSPVKEIGFSTIELTKDGKKDPLFKGLGKEIGVFQWHEDMFMVPEKGALLAISGDCPHQAFRFAENAYALQFHVEITDKSVREWSDEYFKKDRKALNKVQEMLEEYKKKKNGFNKTAYLIYDNFIEIVEKYRKDARK